MKNIGFMAKIGILTGTLEIKGDILREQSPELWSTSPYCTEQRLNMQK